MNLILVGSAAVTVGGLAVPYALFFVPPGAGGGSGSTPAKDALGNELFAKEYLASKKPGDHSLAQGLKGDATYLIVKEDGTLEDFGLNASKFLILQFVFIAELFRRTDSDTIVQYYYCFLFHFQSALIWVVLFHGLPRTTSSCVLATDLK